MRNCQTVLRALAFGAALAFAAPASAQDSIKIGLLSDMSSVLSGAAGQGSVTAAEMAIEDFGGTSEIMKEIIARDFDGAAEGRRRFA